MPKCDYLLPHHDSGILNWGDPLPSCLLKQGHKGEHLVKNCSGQYFVWEFEKELCAPDCDCATSESVTIECYTYGRITKNVAEQLLKSPKRKQKKKARR